MRNINLKTISKLTLISLLNPNVLMRLSILLMGGPGALYSDHEVVTFELHFKSFGYPIIFSFIFAALLSFFFDKIKKRKYVLIYLITSFVSFVLMFFRLI